MQSATNSRAKQANSVARSTRVWAALAVALFLAAGCRSGVRDPMLTFSGSAVGREAEVVRRQLDRFQQRHPDVRIRVRPTPDSADERHQLYVQWLNGHVSDPDVLQLDVIWTPEFAAAGWILDLDRFRPAVDQFFSAAITANRWNGALYALPWFIDVGMLYWRTDLIASPPATFEELARAAANAQATGDIPFGLVWQGARYEGLVTVFLEYLGAFGGRILDESGRVVVDSDASVRALGEMRKALYVDGIVPLSALTWQEEQVRFAFQNGGAVFMRNWPYAYTFLEDSTQSLVAGRFAVAPMPAGPDGQPTAALGGSQLAINARSDEPEMAYALIEYLLEPEQMIERAQVAGQFPSRRALYDSNELENALRVPTHDARRIIEQAVPRPVTPIYAQLSEILQVSLHRALTRQQEPRAALNEAARTMRGAMTAAGFGSEAP